MFWHNFKYSLKTLLKNKMLLFWTLAFPILLGTFFHMAFSDIENSEKLDVINIAIIDNEDFKNNSTFKDSFSILGDENNSERIFDISYTNLNDAKKMLDNDEITGYIKCYDEDVEITVNSNGINETILKYVVDEIKSNQEIMKSLVNNKLENSDNYMNYDQIYSNIKLLMNEKVNLEDISNHNLSYTMIEYYTLIAMTCLYGGILSMFIVNYKLANMNSVGKRTAISPIHKGKMLVGSLLASYVIQLMGLFLLFVYTIFFLKVDYGNNLVNIILLTGVGSLAGLSLGVLIGTIVKSNENVKTGILISVTMLGCFLAGMMGITMKYIIDTNIPILNKINPASMITDGFYSLYYYDTPNRFIFNIVSLIIFSFIMLLVSYKSLRRQKYDSI